MDIENANISNWETQKDNNLKVIGFYNSKAELIALFKRYALETSIQ